MNIEVSREKFLSNFEVLEHLKSIEKENGWSFDTQNKTSKPKRNRQNHLVNLEAATRDVLSYFANTPANTQSKDAIVSLMGVLNGLELEKVEKLQIVNTLPRSMVTLYAVVEECDQRFSEEQCEQMINSINDLFPLAAEEEEVDEEMGDEQGDESKVSDDEFEEAQENF